MPRYDSSMTEERVVEMRIDNDNFEKGAKETISTLEKLEKALKIKGDSSAIDDMADSVRKFDATPMVDSFDTAVKSISNKAAFLQGIFNELGRDIYNFGKDIINNTVTEPIKEGMDKYTTLAETTQTLMAATKDYYTIEKGITTETGRLSAISDVLEMIQWYADETSYSFVDLSDTLAKFVAAGVPIEEAAQAIMGIATASAAAGVNAKDASHTMKYAWQQAFSTGYMSLQDFKTLENQNVATKEFKQNALEIAAELEKISRVAKDGTHDFDDFYSTIIDPKRFDDAGYITKLSEKEEEAMFNWKNMRNSLNEKWFDTDVMKVLLERYGEFSARLYDLVKEVQANEKEIEVSEARDLLEHYRDVGKDDADYWEEAARNLGLTVKRLFELLDAMDKTKWEISETGFYMGQEYKTWQDVLDATRDAVSSQWMKTFKYIFGDFIEAKKLWTEVGSLFYEAFVSWNVTRNSILKLWHDDGGRNALLGIAEDAEDVQGALWNVVDAIKSVVSPISEAFSEAFGFNDARAFADKLIALTERFREWTTELSFSKEAQAGIKAFWKDIFGLLKFILSGIGKGIAVLGKLYTSVIHPLIDFLWKGYKYIRSIRDEIVSWVKGTSVYQTIVGFLEKGKEAFDNFLNTIQNLFAPTKEFKQIILDVKAAIESLHISEKFEKALNFIVENLAKLGIDVTPAIDKIKEAFSSVKEFLSPVISLIEEFKRRLETLKRNEDLTPLQRFFYALQGTGRTALRMINKQLQTFSSKIQELSEKHPKLKDFFDMFKDINIGDVFKSIGTKIAEFYRIAKDAFGKLKIDLSSLWGKIKEGLSFNDILTELGKAFGDFKDAFSEWFNPIKETIAEKFEGLITWLNEIKPKLADAWKSVIDFILSLFGQNSESIEAITRSNPMMQESWFTSLFSWLPEGIQNGLAAIITIIQGAINNFKSTLTTILDGQWAKGLFKDFISLLWGTGAFETGLGIANIGKGFNNITKALKKFSNITKLLNSRAFKKSLLNASKGIKSFFENLGSAFKNGFKFEKINKKVDSIGTTLLKIAGSIAILVASMYVISKMETKDILKSLKTLGILAAGLAAVALVFKFIKFDGTPIFHLALGIGILIGALWVITKFPIETMISGLSRLGVLLLELAVFSRIAGGKNQFYAPFIKLAVALWILMKPLKTLAAMDVGSMVQGLIGLGVVMLEFGVLSRMANTGIKTGGFIAMSVAVGILSFVASKIGEMDVDQLLQGVIGLGAVILEFRTLVKSANGMGKTGGFIPMAIAVGILSYTMSKLVEMDLWSAMKGVQMLRVVINSLSKLLQSAKGFKLGEGLISLLFVAGLLLELWYAFDYINGLNVDFSRVLAFSTSIAEICLGFGYMIKNAKAVSFSSAGATLGELVGFLGIFAGLLAAFTYVKRHMEEEDYEKLLNDIISVSNMLGRVIGELFGGFIAGFGHGIFGDALDGVGDVIQELVERFKEFVSGGFDLEAFGTKLSNFMTNVQGFINGAREIDPSVADNVASLAKAILAITGSEFLSQLLDSLGKMDSIEEFSEDVPKIGKTLQDFSTSFNKIEKVDDTVLDNVDSLSKAITKISGAEFKKSIGEFLTIGETLTDENGNKISSIDKFRTDVVKLGYGLVAFAESISGMPEGSEKNIKNATIAAQGLAELNNSLPTTGGKLQEWLGWKNLGNFAKDLEPLGDALRAYNAAIAGIASEEGTATETDVSTAIEMANGLVALNNALPRSGDDAGLLNFIGWKSLTNFSEDMGPLGRALFAYSASIAGISKGDKVADDADTEQAIIMANGIAKLQNNLAATGGKWAEWFGDEDLSGFATGVTDFGAGIKAYAMSIVGISDLASTEDSTRAIELATSLEDFIEGTSQVGGKVQDFFGRWDLGNFGVELTKLAIGLKIFTDLTKDMPTGSGKDARTVLDPIKEFIDGLEKTGGTLQTVVSEWITGDKFTTLTTQLESMKTMATDLKTFTDDMKLVDADQVDNATTIMGAISTFIDGLDKSPNLVEKAINAITGDKLTSLASTAKAMSDFGSDFQSFASGIAGATQALADLEAAKQLITSFHQLQNESGEVTSGGIISEEDLVNITTLASQIPQAMAEGITSNTSAYNNALTNMQNEGYTTFQYAEQNMYTIGVNLDTGLANGIYANASAPINAMAEVATAVVETAANITEVASPSKAFMRIGNYLDQGLSLGISQNVSDPISSVSSLGDNLITAMQSAMAQVQAIASNQFDLQPQITPVVDMSNVRSSAAKYSSLFGGSIYGRMAGGISRNMAAAQNAQSAYNSMLANTPAAATGDNIQVTVNAAQGQSEEAVATAVINRISVLSSRRKYAFG